MTDRQAFDVELLSRLINSLKRGKAAGLDEPTSDPLQFSHPIVVSILIKLFNIFIFTGHIPVSFGANYTVPIPKCDGRIRVLSVNDFRGISIRSVISKLFKIYLSIYLLSIFISTIKTNGCFRKILKISVRPLIINTASRSISAAEMQLILSDK